MTSVAVIIIGSIASLFGIILAGFAKIKWFKCKSGCIECEENNRERTED